MVGVLFWNACISAKVTSNISRITQVEDAIVDIVVEKNCHIIVLAEFDIVTTNLCNKLSLKGKNFSERKSVDKNARVKILADKSFMSEIIRDSRYYSIHDFRLIDCHFLIAGVHLPSKLYGCAEDRQIDGRQLIEAIKEAEKEVLHEKVIVIGDFNANPFEAIMTDFSFLHAIFDSSIVERIRSRRVSKETNQIFYNPMWNFLGDNNNPKGSYYSDNGKSCKLFWHIFDQIIMSADFIKAFERNSLQILTRTGDKHLINQDGKPDKKNYSDHLPIYFSFKEDLL